MSTISIAGRLSRRLAVVLSEAGRKEGLCSLPAEPSGCFFEDPLGVALGDRAPRCEAQPGRDLAHQPLWQALVDGSYRVPGMQRELHFYEIAGNGIGTRDARRQHLQRVAQWVFMLWLHWYQRAHDERRFNQLRRVVMIKTVKQKAASSRVWEGYLHTMRELAAVHASNEDHGPSHGLEARDPPFQHRFETDPMWVDALARLATRDETAGALAATAPQLLGEGGHYRGLEPDWSWSAPPSPNPVTVTVNAHRCSPSAFRNLTEALHLDRFLALEQPLLLDPAGAAPTSTAAAIDRPEAELDMQTEESLMAREQLLNDMALRLDIPVTVHGSMRYAGPQVEFRDSTPSSGLVHPRPVEPPPVTPLDLALRRLESVPRWDLDPRMLSKELSQEDSSHLVMSVRDQALREHFEEPELGVLVHIEVKHKDAVHRGFALSHTYEPPAAAGPRATGRLLLEVNDARALPFFGTGMPDADGSGSWLWKADCGLVPGTLEPVILLRIEM